MLYESGAIRVERSDGIATLWMHFPGRRPNLLSVERIREVERGIDAAIGDVRTEILVLRSGRPDGFCGGIDDQQIAALGSDAGATAFSAVGQRVCRKLADAPVISVAFLEGPTFGPGLELALACDSRLAVSGPDAELGFPDLAVGLPPAWGGTVHLSRNRRAWSALRDGSVVTARDALPLGLVDDVFCRRRAKIDLRGWLDRWQARPRKRRPGPDPTERLMAERVAFRRAVRDADVRNAWPRRVLDATPPADWGTPINPVPVWPERVGGVGDAANRMAVEFALRGIPATVLGLPTQRPASVEDALANAVRRGRATPLEADEAARRVAVTNVIGDLAAIPFVLVSDPTDDVLRFEWECPPRTVLAVPGSQLRSRWTHPARVVGIEFGPSPVATPAAETSADAAHRTATWLGRVSRSVRFASRTPAIMTATAHPELAAA